MHIHTVTIKRKIGVYINEFDKVRPLSQVAIGRTYKNLHGHAPPYNLPDDADH